MTLDDPTTSPGLWTSRPPRTASAGRDRRSARAVRNALRIERVPLLVRVVVGLPLAGAALHLGTALLLLAGLIGSNCDICAGQPAAGVLLAVVVVLGEFLALRAIWSLVRPGFRPTPVLLATSLVAAWLLRWAWPW